MTSLNKVLLGNFIFSCALTGTFGFYVWRQGRIDARLWVIEHPLIEDEEKPAAEALTPTPEWAKLPSEPVAEPAAVPEPPASPPRKYLVGKRQSLKNPALKDGMTCWAERQAWNQAWKVRNPDAVAKNQQAHRTNRKINDYTIFPGEMTVLPTLEEVAKIKNTVRCKERHK